VGRRNFIKLLSGIAAWPLAGAAQVGKVSTVGILVVGVPDPNAFLGTLRECLAKQGTPRGKI
jgi:hypothetical protein